MRQRHPFSSPSCLAGLLVGVLAVGLTTPTGCGAPPTQTPTQTPGRSDEDTIPRAITSATGEFVGLIDGNSVEITVDGEPRAFRLTDRSRKQVHGTASHQEVRIQYRERLREGVRQWVLESIEPLDPSDRAATQDLAVYVEGERELRTAKLAQTPWGYRLYLLPQFRLDTRQEPYRVSFVHDERFFFTIERVGPTIDLPRLKDQALLELSSLGKVRALRGPEIFDAELRRADFFLQASDASRTRNVVLLRRGGEPFLFRMDLPAAEPAEGVGPSFWAMILSVAPSD
jgi:hypothetical protein